MSDVSNLNLVSLTRRAERKKKELSKGNDKTTSWFKSIYPNRNPVSKNIKDAIAVSEGFNSWDHLRQERLKYCQSIIKRIESPTFYQIQDSSKSIRVLSDIFQDNFINLLPDYLKVSISNLKHVLLAIRDLNTDKKLRQESFKYSLSRVEVVPEHIIIAFFYYDEIKGVLAMKDKHNVIEGFHSSIFKQCTKEGFNKLKDVETDSHILAVLSGLTNPPGPNMKECPVCHSPNPISATECTGCEYSLI